MTFDLKRLKAEYAQLAKKYSLPNFEVMNQKFEIEKLADHETELLARELRRVMMEKASNYFKFIELFINPQTAPIFFLAVIKKINGIERKPLEELYVELGKLEIESINLENEYNEKKEAEFIKRLNKKWEEITKKLGEMIEKLKKASEQEGKEKEKSYFG
jgi:hypothetical protein